MIHLDKDTIEHCLRTEFLVTRIGPQLGISAEELYNLKQVALYHDIGKMMIPSEILNKPGKLTDEEYEIIKRHAEYGYQLTKDQFDDRLRDMIRYHHENVDGSGYYGLRSEQIPFGAKVIHICDVYDAIISDRVYKKGQPIEDAIAFLMEKGGIMFDNELVGILVSMIMEEHSVPERPTSEQKN